MIQRVASASKSFLRWYWNRVKEVPLIVISFTLGGMYVAILLTVPAALQAAVRLM